MPSPSVRHAYTAADLPVWGAVTADLHPPIRLAVFGDPVAHSASPPMHNAALAACGIEARYARVQVAPAELAVALRTLVRAGFIGVNLTLPHKAAALPLLDCVDPHAAALGAVNTVRVEADGTLRGFNTDGPGFVRAVAGEFGCALAGLRVLILGAGGGAGRALATECVLAGCPLVLLVNRTQAKAHALALNLATLARQGQTVVEAVFWKPVALAAAVRRVDLIVNASTLGLQHSDPSPLTAAQMSTRPHVFDTVYRADGTATALITAAKQAGARTAAGRSLLLHQGALSFEHWFERPAPWEVMQAALQS